MTATFCYGVDEVEDEVISTKRNGNNKEVAEKKNKVPKTKPSKKMVENVVHRPVKKSVFQFHVLYFIFFMPPLWHDL